MSKKKKFLYHSDFALAKTVFGRVSKALLTYLDTWEFNKKVSET